MDTARKGRLKVTLSATLMVVVIALYLILLLGFSFDFGRMKTSLYGSDLLTIAHVIFSPGLQPAALAAFLLYMLGRKKYPKLWVIAACVAWLPFHITAAYLLTWSMTAWGVVQVMEAALLYIFIRRMHGGNYP